MEGEIRSARLMFEDEYNVTRLSLFSGQSETPVRFQDTALGSLE